MSMNVYFTVDTESSMGGAWRHLNRRPLGPDRRIFCRIGEKSFGIPLLVEMMREYGFRATYFVETLATPCLGQGDVRSVFDFLLRAGQDVQLHIHPNFYFYHELQKARAGNREYSVPSPSDLIGVFSKDLQLQIIGEASRYFTSFAGYPPKAFRAGCYAGSMAMLECLAEFSIVVDSSFNPCYQSDLSFPGEQLPPNAVAKMKGVWEIPVTVARSPLGEAYNGFKFADCSSLSFPEIRTMLECAFHAGQQHFVMVFHSFSAVKPRDESYTRLRPNWIVIRRLQKLFRYLAEHSNAFLVETMGNIAMHPELLEATHVRTVPTLPVLSAAARKAVQLVNNVYWI